MSYTYDNVGNVTGITDGIDGTRSQAFIYDDINRLIQAQRTAYDALFYTYDQIGNITSKERITYTYAAVGPHQVSSTSDGKTYGYDPDGNMKFDGTRSFLYNSDNMPDTVTAGSETTSYKYDGAGSRVKKITSTGTIVYIGKLYECKDGICSKYVFAGNTRIALKSEADTLYYHQDHLGNSSIITNQNQEVVETIQYYPFGATRTDTGAVSMAHKYTSQEYDPETGLYFYNARYYNPVLGRFISPDTIVPNPLDPQALNRYSYVNNNPVIYNDPSGHGYDWIGPVVGAIIGAYMAERKGGEWWKGAIVGAAAGYTGAWAYGAASTALTSAGWSTFWSMVGAGAAAGAAGGAVGGGLNAALNGGNVWQGVYHGAEYGAIGGAVGGSLSAMGVWFEVSAAGGGYAAGYVECGSGCARQDAWYAFVAASIYVITPAGKNVSNSLLIGKNITSASNIQKSIAHGENAYDADFREVTVRTGGLLSLLRGAHPAITLGSLINIDAGLSTANTTYIMGEELAHVTQYQSKGFGRFLGQYLSECVNGCYNGSLEKNVDYMRLWQYCPGFCEGY